MKDIVQRPVWWSARVGMVGNPAAVVAVEPDRPDLPTHQEKASESSDCRMSDTLRGPCGRCQQLSTAMTGFILGQPPPVMACVSCVAAVQNVPDVHIGGRVHADSNDVRDRETRSRPCAREQRHHSKVRKYIIPNGKLRLVISRIQRRHVSPSDEQEKATLIFVSGVEALSQGRTAA